jgi:hypothetical protein
MHRSSREQSKLGNRTGPKNPTGGLWIRPWGFVDAKIYQSAKGVSVAHQPRWHHEVKWKQRHSTLHLEREVSRSSLQRKSRLLCAVHHFSSTHNKSGECGEGFFFLSFFFFFLAQDESLVVPTVLRVSVCLLRSLSLRGAASAEDPLSHMSGTRTKFDGVLRVGLRYG